MIRYFAATDTTDIGLLALEYLKGILRCHLPTRVASMTGTPEGKWEPYSALLTTPLATPFVNVVCCDPTRWVWTQKVEVPTRQPDGTITSEVAAGAQELWTEGVHNVLITTWDVLVGCRPHQFAAARKYDGVIIPNGPFALPEPMVKIRVPVTDLQHLRDTLVKRG